MLDFNNIFKYIYSISKGVLPSVCVYVCGGGGGALIFSSYVDT